MKALIVDDDRVLADLVGFTLRREGFVVLLAHDGETALNRWEQERPDLVVLDVNLPRSVPPLDGFSLCRRIRAVDDTPIILLTVRNDEEDIIAGLQAGADDYILKPFSPRQLVARIQAVLRRAGQASAPPATRQAGALSLDPSRREARLEGLPPVPLTALECRLLDYFMLNPGQILTTQDLIDHVWGPGSGDRDMLRQLIRRLRTKIEPDPASPTLIETIAGLGYGLKV